MSHLCSETWYRTFLGNYRHTVDGAFVWIYPSAYAHGTEIDLSEAEAIQIHARFDNGDPMSNARIMRPQIAPNPG
ncbi:hypothetical protein KFU94_68670 [Chloroflexi bacterium TSY]|nr:hypothetical protein [Chloroflexi bacterium TSY]